MNVNTKVTLYAITPDGYSTMDCTTVDYSVSENALTIECPEVQQLTTALHMIDAARAKALAEIEEVHRYLDECFINDRDEGRAVPLIDRVVLLVSRWAKEGA
jgi:hypothetical protein